MDHDEADLRIVTCEACGGEGCTLNDDHEDERCPYCEGSGYDLVEVEPIDESDLEKMGA